NFDINEKTIDGENSTYCMATVIFQKKSNTVRSERITRVKSRSLSSQYDKDYTERLKVYAKKPVRSKLTQLEKDFAIKSQKDPNNFFDLDLIWSIGRLLKKTSLSWSDFNNLHSMNNVPVSTIQYLPFINAPPTSYDTIVTALINLSKIAESLKQEHIVTTANLPVCSKAQEILRSNPAGLQDKITVQIGSMHRLMAYIASLGTIFGIWVTELWTEGFYNEDLVTAQIRELFKEVKLCEYNTHEVNESRMKCIEEIIQQFRDCEEKTYSTVRYWMMFLDDGVGDGIKWLFGMPNAEDTKFYKDSIHSLVSDQRQTHKLMQHQVKIISYAITNLNHSILALNRNTNTMNENFEEFNAIAQQTLDMQQKVGIELNITEHLLTLAKMTEEISSLVKDHLNSAILIRHDTINRHILHPSDLTRELLQTATKYTLPLEPNPSNAYHYYKIIKVSSFVHNNLMVITFEIPIVGTRYIQTISATYSSSWQPKPLFLCRILKTLYPLFHNENSLYNARQPGPLQRISICRMDMQEVSTSRRTDQPKCEVQLFSKAITTIPKSFKVRTIQAETEI
ncbi:hypothetical protein ILUMI_19763, partial [Ignelater luminosus]